MIIHICIVIVYSFVGFVGALRNNTFLIDLVEKIYYIDGIYTFVFHSWWSGLALASIGLEHQSLLKVMADTGEQSISSNEVEHRQRRDMIFRSAISGASRGRKI